MKKAQTQSLFESCAWQQIANGAVCSKKGRPGTRAQHGQPGSTAAHAHRNVQLRQIAAAQHPSKPHGLFDTILSRRCIRDLTGSSVMVQKRFPANPGAQRTRSRVPNGPVRRKRAMSAERTGPSSKSISILFSIYQCTVLSICSTLPLRVTASAE